MTKDWRCAHGWLSQPAQKALKEMTEADFDAAHDTGQPAQEPRPWVGLTDEEARIAAFKVPWKDRLAFDAGMFAAANILKEKNT